MMGDEILDPDFERALVCVETGDIATAKRIAERLLRVAPEAPEAPLVLACCARVEADDQRALTLLRKAAALDPDWAVPDLEIADILAADPERLEEALQHAAQALKNAEEQYEFVKAVELKAGIEGDLGRPDAARRTLGELPPPHAVDASPETGFDIGQLFLALEDAAAARKWLERATEQDPDFADAWHALGLACEALGEEEGKRRAWLKTLELDEEQDVNQGERLSEKEVAEVAEQALKELPPRAHHLLENVPILLADRPPREDVATGVDPRLLGLFSGVAYPEVSSVGGTPQLTHILLFRRNLERFAENEEHLREEIRTTLLHETGHFFGMSEEDLAQVGLD
jgi:predicted Zn-dependent protease with MMP-like domain